MDSSSSSAGQTTTPRVSVIVAMSENRVIGRDGQLPWHISADLKRFKALTMGHPIIMGRKTYESIGRLLPGRRTVILTRQSGYRVERAEVFASLDAALDALRDVDEVFIVGGGEVYRQALPRADRIYLTLVHEHVAGDTTFPPTPPAFAEVDRQPHPREGDTPAYTFITLDRRG